MDSGHLPHGKASLVAEFQGKKRYPRSFRQPQRVLVVAPHPDDDAIGCGGTLIQLARRGARINVTYVTDGSASHVRSRRFPPPILRDVREAEARAALRVLGIRREPQFLRAPDSGLTRLGPCERQRLVATLVRRIARSRAHVIFTPWSRDPHPDHVETAAIVAEALRASPRKPVVYAYGVWLLVRGVAADQPHPREVTIRDVTVSAADRERKRAAIMEHRSQTGALIDDDPDGFRIDAAMLDAWLQPVERFYRLNPPEAGPCDP
jgi:LmbE family N-acetylglucosaminyl deacetylase